MSRTRERGTLMSSVQQLLSSLDDGRTLRQNPLVAHFFDARPTEDIVADVRAHVLALIHELAERPTLRSRERALRRREILLRHDIQGVPRETVAEALGITVGHFYRERRIAFSQLGDALLALVPAVKPRMETVSLGGFETAFNAGLQMNAIGGPRVAVHHFERIAQRAHDPEKKIFGLLAAAQLNFDNQNPRTAATYLAACEAMVRWNEQLLTGALSNDIAALIDLARARLLWWECGPVEALRFADRAIHYYMLRMPVMNVEADVVPLQLAISEFMFFGAIAWYAGDAVRSRRPLLTVGKFLDRLSAPYLRVGWLSESSLIRVRDGDEPLRLPKADLSEALAIAQSQSYPAWGSYAAAIRAQLAARERDIENARTFQQVALDLADVSDSQLAAGVAMTVAARIEERLGNPARARAIARRAAIRVHGYPATFASALLVLGSVELKCRNLEVARSTVEELFGMKTALDRDPRLHGGALLLQGECAFAAGDRSTALRKIDELIDLLRSGAPAYLLKESEQARKHVLRLR